MCVLVYSCADVLVAFISFVVVFSRPSGPNVLGGLPIEACLNGEGVRVRARVWASVGGVLTAVLSRH